MHYKKIAREWFVKDIKEKVLELKEISKVIFQVYVYVCAFFVTLGLLQIAF